MEIKVLGLGCGKCRKTYNIIEKVILENNLNINLSKVEDIEEMTTYRCYLTPAIVIDGEIFSQGVVPKEKEIKSRLIP